MLRFGRGNAFVIQAATWPSLCDVVVLTVLLGRSRDEMNVWVTRRLITEQMIHVIRGCGDWRALIGRSKSMPFYNPPDAKLRQTQLGRSRKSCSTDRLCVFRHSCLVMKDMHLQQSMLIEASGAQAYENLKEHAALSAAEHCLQGSDELCNIILQSSSTPRIVLSLRYYPD